MRFSAGEPEHKMKYDLQAEKKKNDRILLIMRACAVFSIISAHCQGVWDNASSISCFLTCFLGNVGHIGVGTFFLISGYVFPFSREKTKGFFSFFSHKITRIVVPWLFCATITYCGDAVISCVLYEGSWSFQGWFTTLYRHIFWFMFVLVLLYLIYYYPYQKKYFLEVTVILSLISHLLIALRVIPPNDFAVYHNPINWMLFFSSGIYLNRMGLSPFFSIVSRMKWLLCFAALLVMLIISGLRCKFRYSSPFFLPVEILCIGSNVAISILLYECPPAIGKWFVEIGKRSFSIYLLHMFLFTFGIIGLSNKTRLAVTIPLRPIAICLSVFYSISIGHWIAKIIHMDKVYSILIGDRS